MIVHVWEQSPRFRGTRSTGQWHCAPLHADVLWQLCRCREPTKGWSVQYKISIIQEKKKHHAIHYLFTDAYHLAIHLCTVNRYEDAKHSPRCLSSIQINQSAEKQKVCKPKQLQLNFKRTHSWIHSSLILMLLRRKAQAYCLRPSLQIFFFQQHLNDDVSDIQTVTVHPKHPTGNGALHWNSKWEWRCGFWGRHRGDSALTGVWGNKAIGLQECQSPM